MAINIKKGAAASADAATGASAHDEAAAAIESEVATTTTKSGVEAPLAQDVQKTTEPVHLTVTAYERIDVGMSFKMPVASYTMLEFSVRRSVPFDPATTDADEVFATAKSWVEGKLNDLIAEQQNG